MRCLSFLHNNLFLFVYGIYLPGFNKLKVYIKLWSVPWKLGVSVDSLGWNIHDIELGTLWLILKKKWSYFYRISFSQRHNFVIRRQLYCCTIRIVFCPLNPKYNLIRQQWQQVDEITCNKRVHKWHERVKRKKSKGPFN